MKKISMIVYDFDGVLTDNRVWVHQDGTESVACNRSDGWWISKIKEKGIPQVILSTEKNPVVSKRGEKLGLEVVQGQNDKGAALLALADHKRISISEVCYVGNEMNDFECFKTAGHSAAPCDSHPRILEAAHYVIPEKGGHGIVRYLFEHLFDSRRIE